MSLASIFVAVAAQAIKAKIQSEHKDQDLIQGLRLGDEAAFVELVERFQEPLERVARRFVSSQALAEELVQDTWLAVLKGVDRFEGRSSLKTWIFTILSNRAKTRGRKESRSQPFSSMPEAHAGDEDAVNPDRFTIHGAWAAPPGRWHEAQALDKLQSRETVHLIQVAIEALPTAQRAVVQLRDVEGFDAKEICNILDLSETYQRVLLHRGRSRLRQALEDQLSEDS